MITMVLQLAGRYPIPSLLICIGLGWVIVRVVARLINPALPYIEPSISGQRVKKIRMVCNVRNRRLRKGMVGTVTNRSRLNDSFYKLTVRFDDRSEFVIYPGETEPVE